MCGLGRDVARGRRSRPDYGAHVLCGSNGCAGDGCVVGLMALPNDVPTTPAAWSRNLETNCGVGPMCACVRYVAWKPEPMKTARASLVIAALALSACSTAPSGSEARSCEPSTTEAEPILGAEARAHSTEGLEVWALFFNTWPLPPGEAVRIPVDEEVKIVWRSTGDGAFTIEAGGPDGMSVEPVWGPDVHGSSNWERPGQEWGTGWIFPATGCWTFEVSRGNTSARVVAEVFASATPVTTDQ